MSYSNFKPRFNNKNRKYSSFSNSNFRFRDKGGRGFSKKNKFSKEIDHSKYIQKAEVATETTSIEIKTTFQDFDLLPELKKLIQARGFIKPTPIQQESIPSSLSGIDLVGIADTGTGKTGAFLIPSLNAVLKAKKERRKAQTLIVAPTRELAQQIFKELTLFDIQKLNIYASCFVGGKPILRDIQRLKRFQDFVIGTPGRLKDLVHRKALNLKNFCIVIMDEVDRILDMGFLSDIEFLLEQTSPERQSLFFSATLTKEIKPIIEKFSKNPKTVSLGNTNSSKNVDQDIVKITKTCNKNEVLFNILKETDEKVLVFVATKRMTEELSNYLYKQGHRSDCIHGDKSQFKRQQALERFKKGEVKTLLATDVAARGIDIQDIHLVINFDEPNTFEDYVHRIGRTGRAGKKGRALTFVRTFA
jgi:superfamily II DNA/RNA helicase